MSEINEKNIISFNVSGVLYNLKGPLIMGIINCTPDSFFSSSRFIQAEQALDQAAQMIEQGVDILDIGGQSSRPGAVSISAQEELDRILPTIEALRTHYPQLLISVDTYYAEVANQVLKLGVHIINDISAGTLDPDIIQVVSSFKVPYIIMHMQGTPKTMQHNPQYEAVVNDIIAYLAHRKQVCLEQGVFDVWVDPGFGFGKTLEQNYQILNQLPLLNTLIESPVLVGISRKSMIYKLLNITPEASLCGTSALHLQALLKGAQIIRVHDVLEASQMRTLFYQLQNNDMNSLTL